MNRAGNANSDWNKATLLYRNPVRRFLLRLNKPLIQVEKKAVEPLATWIESADIFRIIERVSPAIEALGVLAIPLVLFIATQNYQESTRQQELDRVQKQAVRDYYNQLSTVFLSAEGNIRNTENQRLRITMTAMTLNILEDQNLSDIHKGEIVEFLYRMDLITRETVYGPLRPRDDAPVLNLRNANLENADLSFLNLSRIDLSVANMRNANLHYTDLSYANLNGSNLNNADLSNANLSNANMFCRPFIAGSFLQDEPAMSCSRFQKANIRGVNLNNANLSGIRLEGADLSNASLAGTNFFCAGGSNSKGSWSITTCPELEKTNLEGVDLQETYIPEHITSEGLLCETSLPTGMVLNPNRDCRRLRPN